ncbi:MAG: PIN domain-containing protein [Prevotella sp.]|nr:PIN domain-containing protein [Prevotella sp.]MBR6187688.1 PIN domain-containing protein [Prevotella sp.]
MRGYLLDTSICVAIFRGNRHVAAKMNEVGKGRCFITQIVVAELLFGAYRSKHVEENLEQTREFIKEVKLLPFADSVDVFAKERARLWDAGKKIEDFDLLNIIYILQSFMKLTYHHLVKKNSSLSL